MLNVPLKIKRRPAAPSNHDGFAVLSATDVFRHMIPTNVLLPRGAPQLLWWRRLAFAMLSRLDYARRRCARHGGIAFWRVFKRWSLRWDACGRFLSISPPLH